MSRLIVTLFLAAISLAGCGSGEDDYVARMEREHRDDVPVPSGATQARTLAEVTGEQVVYATLEGVPVAGYLARPPGGGAAPGLVVIHEWWGLNDNIRSMARRLAGEGYTALAVDLYEGEVAEDRENAGRLARASGERAPRLRENLRQAVRYLEERADATSVGTIGWCFGGGWSLQTALLLGDQVDACVIYYGRLPTEPSELEPLAAPVLGIFGDQDRGIPPETVREFEAALATLGKEASIHLYAGADHAFANPSGAKYQPEAAEDAWDKTLEFFSRHLE